MRTDNWTSRGFVSAGSHELMIGVALLAVIAVIVIPVLKDFAASKELVGQYESLRDQLILHARDKQLDLCGDPPISLVSTDKLKSLHATLSVVKVKLGQAAPLGLKIDSDTRFQDEEAVKIAARAYNIFQNQEYPVAPGKQIEEEKVSFTVMLVNEPCSIPSSSGNPKPSINE